MRCIVAPPLPPQPRQRQVQCRQWWLPRMLAHQRAVKKKTLPLSAPAPPAAPPAAAAAAAAAAAVTLFTIFLRSLGSATSVASSPTQLLPGRSSNTGGAMPRARRSRLWTKLPMAILMQNLTMSVGWYCWTQPNLWSVPLLSYISSSHIASLTHVLRPFTLSAFVPAGLNTIGPQLPQCDVHV